ncbi:MAG: PspC domain-containing protein [Terriglobales bacterium]
MYCNACGNEVGGNARFCAQCGRALPQAALPRGHRRPLERPRQGRKVAGVCLAIANSMDVDPTLVRVLWAVFTVALAFVFGAVAYLVAWILIPEEPFPVAVQPVSAPAGPSA